MTILPIIPLIKSDFLKLEYLRKMDLDDKDDKIEQNDDKYYSMYMIMFVVKLFYFPFLFLTYHLSTNINYLLPITILFLLLIYIMIKNRLIRTAFRVSNGHITYMVLLLNNYVILIIVYYLILITDNKYINGNAPISVFLCGMYNLYMSLEILSIVLITCFIIKLQQNKIYICYAAVIILLTLIELFHIDHITYHSIKY